MSFRTTTFIHTTKEVPSYYKRLSICINPNGFSFSRTTTQDVLLSYGEVEMDMNRSFSELSRDLKSFIDEQQISPFEFGEMKLVVPSEQVVLMPLSLYESKSDRQYLESAYSTADGMGVFSASIKSADAQCIFSACTNLVTAFKIVLPGIDVCCQYNVLVSESLLAISTQSPLILLHQRNKRADYVVCNDGAIVLCNSLNISTNEDRLFHTLDMMKSLGVESPNMNLLLCGQVDRVIYASLQGYFPRITLFSGRPMRYINPEFAKFPTYRNMLSLN